MKADSLFEQASFRDVLSRASLAMLKTKINFLVMPAIHVLL